MTDLKQKYDASTVAVMRQALSEVVTDRRFLVRKSVTPLEVAENILQQAASGERDLNRRAFILEALDGDRSAEGLDAVTQADEPRAARRIAAADPVVTRDDA